MKNFLWMLLLIVFPKKFVAVGTEDAIEKEFRSNIGLLTRYPNKQLPEQEKLEFRQGIEENSLKVRKSIIRSFFSLFVVIVGALISANLINFSFSSISPSVVAYIRLFSVFLLFWSVWGRVGWEIQTFKGQTLPEIVNANWAKVLYLTGTFFAILSYLI